MHLTVERICTIPLNYKQTAATVEKVNVIYQNRGGDGQSITTDKTIIVKENATNLQFCGCNKFSQRP